MTTEPTPPTWQRLKQSWQAAEVALDQAYDTGEGIAEARELAVQRYAAYQRALNRARRNDPFTGTDEVTE